MLQQKLLNMVHPFLGEGYPLSLLIHFEITLRFIGVFTGVRIFITLFKKGNNAVYIHKLSGIVFSLTGDNQGRSSLIDQDRVNFINDAVVVVPLYLLLRAPPHIVA